MVSSRSNINISNLHGFRNRWVFFSRSLKNRARASMCVRQEQVHVLTMLMSFNQYIFLCIYVGTTNEIYHISLIYRVSQKNALSECCWSSAKRPRVRLPFARFLDKVTLPEAALLSLSSNSILKVRFFWDTPYITYIKYHMCT